MGFSLPKIRTTCSKKFLNPLKIKCLLVTIGSSGFLFDQILFAVVNV